MEIKTSWKGYVHDIIFPLIIPPLSLALLQKIFSESGREKIKRGVIPRFSFRKLERCDILIHSSSIGETKNALLFSSFIREEIKKRGKEVVIKHTVFTKTAEQAFNHTRTKQVEPIPLPLYIVLRRFVPSGLKMLIFYERDLWPAYIISAKEKGAKVIVVSGKMSEKSAYMYKIFGMQHIFSMVDKVFSASEENSQRFKKAGFKNVVSSIDLKNLVFLKNINTNKRKNDFEEMRRDKKKKILIGISLRGKEEIEFMIGCHNELKKYGYYPLTFIAPRHSFKEAEELLRDKKTNFVKLSEFESILKIQDVINTANNKKLEIVLVDKYGVIENILPFCDFSFVGGSLIPIGGHNVLEPISYGIPTASGENIWNIEEREELIRSGVLNIVRKPQEMAGLVIKSDELKKTVEKYSEEKREKVKKELLKIIEEISTILEV